MTREEGSSIMSWKTTLGTDDAREMMMPHRGRRSGNPREPWGMRPQIIGESRGWSGTHLTGCPSTFLPRPESMPISHKILLSILMLDINI